MIIPRRKKRVPKVTDLLDTGLIKLRLAQTLQYRFPAGATWRQLYASMATIPAACLRPILNEMVQSGRVVCREPIGKPAVFSLRPIRVDKRGTSSVP